MLLIKEFQYIFIHRCIYLLHLTEVKPDVAFRDVVLCRSSSTGCSCVLSLGGSVKDEQLCAC